MILLAYFEKVRKSAQDWHVSWSQKQNRDPEAYELSYTQNSARDLKIRLKDFIKNKSILQGIVIGTGDRASALM